MSKTKSSELAHYELLFIVPNKFTEDESKAIVKKVEGMIVKEGGKITYREDWGKRKFAYEIQKYDHGYYSLFEFDLEGINLAKIDRALRMSNEILRHQIVVKQVKTEKQVAKEKEILAKIAAKNIAKEEDAKVEEEAKEKKEQAKDKDKDKVDLKDLDEKLDNILDTDDLL